MSRSARACCALVAGLLLACHEGGEQGGAEAARADSSAAGYAVGGSSAATTAAAQRDVATRADSAHAESTTIKPRRDSAVAKLAARRDSIRTTPAPHRDSVRVVAAAHPPADTTSHVARTAAENAATHAASSGPVHVNDFLTYDPRTRTASVQLIAGFNGVNGSLNYNGATRGARVLAIPLGWRVHVTVSNHDSDLQHSAIVVDEVLPPPLELTTPAFPGAALPRLDEGLDEDETGTLDFVASKAGRYMLACGVPGHAQSGMWLRLVVARGIATPAYR